MPERLTDARIDELLELEAKATPGEWNYDGMHNELTTTHRANGEYWIVVSESRNTPEDKLPARDEFGHYENPNFRLLAASRNSIRSLLEEVRERRAAEMEILRALRSAESHYKQSENCGVCHPIGDCPTLRVISAAIARAEKES